MCDTHMANFLFIGLIRDALPQARLIHCVRDPLDHCLQIYFKTYQADHKYSYDLDQLGLLYLSYEDIMRQWYELFGDCILTVRYEELIRNPIPVAERIYSHCDLDLDPSKLKVSFHDKEIGPSRHYEKHITELREILNRHPRPAW